MAKTAAPTGLDSLRREMTKRYGNNRVRLREEVKPYDIVSSGSLTLDVATRIGGFPYGRITEIVGQAGAGKTTISITTMREAQKRGPVAYIDMEQTFDYAWAEKNGLDTSDKMFLHVFPDDSEDVSDMIRAQLGAGVLSAVVIDSIGGMESRKAFEKDAGDVTMGKNAQVITRMVKQVAVLARQYNSLALFVNQYRANLSNPMTGDVPSGPKALGYATSMRIEMARAKDRLITKINGQEEIVGQHFRARITRSKVAAQHTKAEFFIKNQPSEEWGEVGIFTADEALTLGNTFGVIGRRGSWYDLPDGSNHNGEERARLYLVQHPEVALQLRDLAVAKVAHDVIPNTSAVPEDIEVPA